MSKFERPESLSFPHVYYTFKAKDKNSNDVVEYRVQDLPEDYYERAIDLIVTDFVPQETFCLCKKISESSISIQAISDFYRVMFKNRLTIACFRNDGSNDDLVAVNVFQVKSIFDKKDDDFEYGDKNVADVFKAVDFSSSLFDVYSHYKVDKYLYGIGLCVDEKYRGRGIATEMLKARAPVLKALNLTLTSTAFSAIGSQIAATKAGYEEIFSIAYEDLQKKISYYDFSASKTKFFKTLAMKI